MLFIQRYRPTVTIILQNFNPLNFFNSNQLIKYILKKEVTCASPLITFWSTPLVIGANRNYLCEGLIQRKVGHGEGVNFMWKSKIPDL